MPENSVLEADPIPLVQSDYTQMDEHIPYQDVMQRKGILGSYVSYESDSLVYRIFESRYDWILKRIWQEEEQKFHKIRDCTGAWEAVLAVEENQGEEGRYLVRYPDKLLIFWCSEGLEEEQIQEIMGIWSWFIEYGLWAAKMMGWRGNMNKKGR